MFFKKIPKKNYGEVTQDPQKIALKKSRLKTKGPWKILLKAFEDQQNLLATEKTFREP